MEKSNSNATQIAPSSTTTSSLPPSTATDQRSSSPAMVAAEMNVDSSPAFTPTPTVPTPPSIATTDPSSARGRKRALEGNHQIENSNYYKIRLILKDLRPHVLEVLRTPDFRNCKAATEIKEKMKVMLELYKEMIGESPKREKTAKSESLSNGKTTTTNEKQSSNGDGASVVGGSAFGWNFITYGGKDVVYYGMSKEEYRKSHPIGLQKKTL